MKEARWYLVFTNLSYHCIARYGFYIIRVSFRGAEGAFAPPWLWLAPLGNFDLKVNQFICLDSALCIINVNKSLKYCMYIVYVTV